MIFYNKYNISLSRVILMMEREDPKLICRFGIPLPGYKKAYNKIVVYVAQIVNGVQMNDALTKGIVKARLYNKAYNLYPAYYLMAINGMEKLAEIETVIGKKVKGVKELELFKKRIDKLQAKFREYIEPEKEQTEGDNVSFSQIVISVETILGPMIPRSTRLFEFEYYFKQANDKIKRLKTLSQNGGNKRTGK